MFVGDAWRPIRGTMTALTRSKQVYGVPHSGWSSPQWNWGYGSGTGHDCAVICRTRYATSESRTKLVESLILMHPDTDVEEIKLVLALLWQKCRRDNSDGGVGGYRDVLQSLVKADRYESSTDGISRLTMDMLARLPLIQSPEIDAVSKAEAALRTDPIAAFRYCSGIVLKAMDFEVIGA
jgi:hypothetical protein